MVGEWRGSEQEYAEIRAARDVERQEAGGVAVEAEVGVVVLSSGV